MADKNIPAAQHLPEALRKLQEDVPGIRIIEQKEPSVYNASGRRSVLSEGVLLMRFLEQILWDNGKQFRVTIECDPEAGRFELNREDLT